MLNNTEATAEALRTSSYSYDLPPELIAHRPADVRDNSRLFVMRGQAAYEHRFFRDLLDYLEPGDLLVTNNTKVLPARLYGTRVRTGATIEILLLKPVTETLNTSSDLTAINTTTAGQTMSAKQPQVVWECLSKPAKRCRVGDVIEFSAALRAEVIEEGEQGMRKLHFVANGDFYELIDDLGELPLPPYIHERPADPSRYQTVYAEIQGSVAAPTAGLHFTQELLTAIENKGIKRANVTLNVGLGTFRPVQTDMITEHPMHVEHYDLSAETAAAINRTRVAGGRIIAVGTTSCRVLETAAKEQRLDGTKLLRPSCGDTDLFIYPGFDFRLLDGLITNFHLPESTLLMLVSALMGRAEMLAAYAAAVTEKYRFFSFGDAMFLLPQRTIAGNRAGSLQTI